MTYAIAMAAMSDVKVYRPSDFYYDGLYTNDFNMDKIKKEHKNNKRNKIQKRKQK